MTTSRDTRGGSGGSGGQDQYRELFERSADAILIIEDGRFVDCNQATVEMLRYDTKEELLRTHPSELSPPTQPDGRSSYEKADEMMATAFARGSLRFEWDHQRRDGEVFPAEVLLTAITRDDRQILHVVWRDISDRKSLEARLRHTQKMEMIGTLTGGIAHDFNNLLVAILGNGELLHGRLGADQVAHEYLAEILHAGQRAATLVRQLLTFSRRQELPATNLDLVTVVRDVQSMLSRLIDARITLSVTCEDATLPIRGSVGQLEQVIVNLVTNARDAMPEGGTITVLLKAIDVTADSIGIATRLAPGRYAAVVVTDTGAGMTDEVKGRAVEPFFTTKDVGEGTGLGLSTVYGIAAQAGGGLTLDSMPGRGTTVTVFFPLLAGQAAAAGLADEVAQIRGGTERVLVVEDDEAVARVVVEVLGAKGYQVTRARHGVEALELSIRGRGELDLIVTDVVMPRMDGAALVEVLRARGNQVRVLFMSGYARNALAALGDITAIDLLEKPFTAAALAARVRQALDRPR